MLRVLSRLVLFAAGLAQVTAHQYTHLTGLILDPSAAAVPGSIVTLVNEQTGFRRVTRSQRDGGYAFASLQPGTYKLTVRKEGFRTVIRFGLKLDVAQPARLDLMLSVGSMHEAVTVEGGAPVLNTEDASIGTVISRRDIERLPLNGRGLLSLLELAPGTVVTPATRGEAGQFTSNGQRANTHYFTVDGVSVNTGVSGGGLPAQATGGSLPGMTAFGSYHNLVSLEALEEFRVQTSTVIPEFGRLPGAQVSLSSRSGSNQLRGSLFQYFRHELLDANDWFANRHGDGRAPLRLHDFGGALGGPIHRNRTFFFASYEGIRLRQPYAWRTSVPSLAVRDEAPEWARPLLGLSPQPNGPALSAESAEWTGRNHRPSRIDAGGLRIDHALTARVTLLARYNEAPSASEFGSTQVGQLSIVSRSITLGSNVRLRPSLLLDTRANFSHASLQSQWSPNTPVPACYLQPVFAYLLNNAAVCDYFVRFTVTGTNSIIFGRESERRQDQLHVSQAASFNRGSHSMRFGADYRWLAPSRRDASGSLNIIAGSFNDLNATQNLWVSNSAPLASRSVLTEMSLFAQDTWRVTPRVTATYGLRWEFSPAPRSDQPAYYFDPAEGLARRTRRDIWAASYTNFAPRFGIAYTPRKGGRTVLRGGAGVYYDTTLSFATDLVNGGPMTVQAYGSSRAAPFTMLMSYGFMPSLRLPLVKQWSTSVEHAFRGREAISIAYAGSSGRRLVRREMGGAGSTHLFWLALATNHGSSDYHSMQVQYRRRMARRLQAVVSYTWSHSIDDSSTDAVMHWAGSGLRTLDDRGSSDFDARQAVTAAVAYELPSFLRGWALDGIFRARSGFPINVLNAEQSMGLTFANVFRPNLVPGQPVWVSDRLAPGGRRLNAAAFEPAPRMVQGNLGRNSITGFGMSQVDIALRREFSLREKRSVQFRVECFNLLNQANLGDPVRFLTSPLFGQSISMLNLMLGTGSPGSGLAPVLQIGGPRSVQLSVRFGF